MIHVYVYQYSADEIWLQARLTVLCTDWAGGEAEEMCLAAMLEEPAASVKAKLADLALLHPQVSSSRFICRAADFTCNCCTLIDHSA
jgi:hypothetical protein